MTHPQPQHEPTDPRQEILAEAEPRRGFLMKFAAGSIGALVAIVPFVTGLIFFLDPLYSRKAKKGEDGKEGDFVPVAHLDALPADGTPRKFMVFKDAVNAWNRVPDQPVGAVYLRRTSERTVEAFNVECPHLGCSVNYRPENTDFFCPCHTSAFSLDGERKNDIPPRPMDSLETQVTDDGRILVHFQKFRIGTHDKTPV